MAGEYWFARRFPVGNPRNAMAPVSPEGYRVVYTFIGAAVGGLLLWIIFAMMGQWLAGIIVFILGAGGGGWYFIQATQGKGDHQHTIEDYRAGRVGQSSDPGTT